ncbi:hypothetical protein OSB04_010862, partial [Centaurea solstitialis]
MASNPPFLVEDTDEDFFDKLVNDDDDDFKPAPLLASKVGSNIVDDNDNDSDEAKAFANLSISDVGTGLEDLETVGSSIGEEDIKPSSSVNKDHKDESASVNTTHVEKVRPLVSSNSFAFDSVNEGPDNEATQLKEPLGSTASEDHGSGGAAGVKEVQWSAFASDSVENGRNAFGSYPDFFNAFGDGPIEEIAKEDNLISTKPANDYSQQFQGDQVHTTTGVQANVNDYSQQLQGDQAYATAGGQGVDGQDPNSSQYWENLYPGWKYDASTGQWYQVDESYNATASAQGAYDPNSASDWTASNEKSEVSYLQQTAQSVAGAVAETGTTESITSWNSVSQASQTNESLSQWNQASQDNTVYPSHMTFDPQYPGWYYDTNLQEWHSLDEYNSQSTVQAQNQVNQNGFGATDTYYGNDQKTYGGQGELEQAKSEVYSNQGQDYNWNGSFSNAEQQSSTMWQPNTVANSAPMSDFRANQQVSNNYGTNFRVDNHVNQQQSYNYGTTALSFNKASQINNEFPVSGSQSFAHGGSFSQPFSQTLEQNEMMSVSKAYGNQNQFQQAVQSGHQVPYAVTAGRSSAGRPPHALVTFGFGGKLIVMKDSTALGNASYGSQDSKSGSISVLNVAEAVTGGVDASNSGASVHDYFHALCQQSFPGPLAGGNVGGKDLNRWIDERITHCGTSDVDYRQAEVLRLLLSLLKIAVQHYGKLRSPFGSDTTLKENDAPELAVARLFASVKGIAEHNNYGALAHCLQQVPSEGQIRETAAEVQTLLVSGSKKEALLRAQEGQLWGPALVLAAQLGDQFYVDTVKKMALRQLVPGSPLRTLCLLIAGQPADVFAADATTDSSNPGAVNMSAQPAQAQLTVNGMLDDWEDNLAVITANRTKDDELVLIHLGDCLWKERSNIIAAHICYLVAEANFEPYSDSARVCLIGADHWKHPRTYASPEAIQRTEVYEYSKLLGNSQFTLLPFQPYKLIYAHMLAEVGRVSDSLKYCQVVSKSLKTGRAPEVETWRQLVISLEDRIKTHQAVRICTLVRHLLLLLIFLKKGGFTNLAPGKLVGKLLNLFDSTAHRVVGGLPPPVPSTSGVGAQYDHHHQPKGPRVSTSQSTMAMSSLMPSASMEPINQTDGNNRGIMHNRSASEPDFGRSPRQDQEDTSKENSADSRSKASGNNTSRFSRFGFGSHLFQKTVGLVLKTRQDKQAKLGETNKFYYDEKLKRWVEEGTDPPAEEAALPPPPTMATFQNGTSDYNLKSALRTESVSSGSSDFGSPTPPPSINSGIPPIPAASNQFSARGRMGVRARYVDTFNQGGGNPTNLFQSPSVPTIQPKTSPNPKFFVPTAAPTAEQQATDPAPDNFQPQTTPNIQTPNIQTPSMSSRTSPSPSPSTAMGMPRFASMDDISKGGTSASTSTSSFSNQPISLQSRRTLSWSGSANEDLSASGNNEFKAFGGMGMGPPPTFTPNKIGFTHPSNDDLQESGGSAEIAKERAPLC